MSKLFYSIQWKRTVTTVVPAWSPSTFTVYRKGCIEQFKKAGININILAVLF